MPAKVKGFFKGLRYISHIFESEKEPELQIGLPTDVKHVAHIGWEGPSSNAPSWMSEFNSTQLTLPPVNPIGEANNTSSKLGSEDVIQTGTAIQGSLLQNKKDIDNSPRGPLSTGFGPPLGSPPKRSAKRHHLRRHRDSANSSADSTTQESALSRHSRRQHKSGDPSSNDQSSGSKQSRRRRSSKGSSGGGSSRTSKSKEPDSTGEPPATDPRMSTVEEGSEEGNR